MRGSTRAIYPIRIIGVDSTIFSCYIPSASSGGRGAERIPWFDTALLLADQLIIRIYTALPKHLQLIDITIDCLLTKRLL